MELLHAFALALLLGMQHGLDPDHLAAIDGLTRFNARVNPARARWCGLWFSLGHGTLVTLATLLVATLDDSTVGAQGRFDAYGVSWEGAQRLAAHYLDGFGLVAAPAAPGAGR